MIKYLIRFLVLIFTVELASGTQFYTIDTTWNSTAIDHLPVNVILDHNDMTSFLIQVIAPFFDDPKPQGPPGQAFYGLWDYEVVEVFFLNDNNQYVEIELGPHGQHIVLLLNGQRVTVRHSLSLNYTTSVSSGNWYGQAIVPVEYLPPNVTKMNAYAIHGTGEKRVYEALYPVPSGTAGPDFHNLAAFKPFDPSIIVSAPVTQLSPTWKDSLIGVRTLEMKRTWEDEVLLSADTAQLTLSIMNKTSLKVTIDAPFYNDTPPQGPQTGGPLDTLSSYEVIHLFLLGASGEYLELQFGPWNHYLVAFWSGYLSQAGNTSSPINYSAMRQSPRWMATAVVPLSYLPPNVTKCNAHLVHGQNTSRKVSSVYPAGPQIVRDFHNATFYRAIDFDILYPKTVDPSCFPHWYAIYPECGSGAVNFLANRPLLAVSLLIYALANVF